MYSLLVCVVCFFFFNDTATTEIYTLSLHDALPIFGARRAQRAAADRGLPPAGSAAGPGRPGADRRRPRVADAPGAGDAGPCPDRKSTRLNSSHANISYAVFCLKKKKTPPNYTIGHT